MKLLPRIAAVVAIGASLALAAGPAFAAPNAAPSAKPSAAKPSAAAAKLDAAKKLVTARIDGRLAALKAHSTTVQSAAHLSSAHKTTLSRLISADQSGLGALRTKVAGETTLAAVKADDQSMVADFRIYLLVGPKVRLTVAADTEAAAIPQAGEGRRRTRYGDRRGQEGRQGHHHGRGRRGGPARQGRCGAGGPGRQG